MLGSWELNTLVLAAGFLLASTVHGNAHGQQARPEVAPSPAPPIQIKRRMTIGAVGKRYWIDKYVGTADRSLSEAHFWLLPNL